MGNMHPATGWRKIWGARGARRPAPSVPSPRFGPIEGLESEIVGQTFGPRRVPSQGAPWPLIVAAGAVLVLAALMGRWGWVRAHGPQDPSPAPAQAQSASQSQGASPSGEAYLAVAQRTLEDPPQSGGVERTDDTAPVEPPVPVAALPERMPGTAVRAASSPVPTLFLDEVAQASDDLSHEPVTLELFKATLPQRSANTDPLRHAAGAVTESSENR